MAQVTRAASKLKFQTGDVPTQADFEDLHDSVTWYDEGGGGVSDGDKGDIVVSGSGAVWKAKQDDSKYQNLSGLSLPFQPHLAFKRIVMIDPQYDTTGLTTYGIGQPTISANSTTSSALAWNTFPQTIKRVIYSTSSVSGNAASIRSNLKQWFRGYPAGIGGFYVVIRFGLRQAQASYLFFCGLLNQTTAISGATVPSSLINMIGIGLDSTDTTFQVMCNDDTGTATKVNTSVTPSSSTLYEASFYCPPNGSTVYVNLKDLNSGSLFQTSLSTDLPAVDTQLAFQIALSNNASSSVISFDFAGLYAETIK